MVVYTDFRRYVAQAAIGLMAYYGEFMSIRFREVS